MIALGVDPDTFSTGLALVETLDGRKGRVLAVRTAASTRRSPVEKRVVQMALSIREALEELRGEAWDLPGDPTIRAVAVEGQKKYPNDRTRPNDLIRLAQVAGEALAVARGLFPLAVTVEIPDPQDWKGQVPKRVHQRRILKRVGLERVEDLAAVPGGERLTTVQLGHVVDAVGLALYAAQCGVRAVG